MSNSIKEWQKIHPIFFDQLELKIANPESKRPKTINISVIERK